MGRRAEAVAGWGSINTHVYVDQRGFKGYCNSFREEPKSGKYNGNREGRGGGGINRYAIY